MSKTIVVTGGSSGIGLSTVRRLATEGHRVFAASRNPSRTELPPGVTPVVCDVSAPECTAVLDHVASRAGSIDVLVNNAGITELVPIEETTDDDARRIFDVNLFGPMRMCRAVVPLMRDGGGGRIVNVTSLNDALSSPFGGWYSASKAALAAASYSLAAEVQQYGIRVTVVAPGLFATDMAAATSEFEPSADSRYRRALEQMKAMQTERVQSAGDPDVVAAAIQDAIESDEPPVRVVVGDDATAMVAAGIDPNAYVPAVGRFIAAVNQPG